MSGATDIGAYYDNNTGRFLRLGHGGEELAIRRAVWGPGTTARGQAIQYVNSLIHRELARIAPTRVVDLGCGVGGSILYLGRRLPAAYKGVTISSVQASLGRQFLGSGAGDAGGFSASIDTADFTDTGYWKRTIEEGRFDGAYAVESFIHVPRLLERIPAILQGVREGGVFILCDDMLSRSYDPAAPGRRESRFIREFQQGWHAHGLAPVPSVIDAVVGAGFRLLEVRDLTPYLDLDRPRDLAIRGLMAFTRALPIRASWFENLLGGNALQMGLKNGVIRYVYAVFQRSNSG